VTAASTSAATSTAIGTLAAGVMAHVDEAGTVRLVGGPLVGGPTVAWYVAADDRWHTPSKEAAVRQRLIDGVPVVETSVRIPGGDAVQRVYAVPDDGGLVLIEIENVTTLPFAVAFDTSEVRATRAPATVPIEGITLPEGSVVIPVGKTSVVRVAIGRGSGPLVAVPAAADVVRGWTQALDRSPRLVLLDDVLVARMRSGRADVLLAPPPVFDRSGDLIAFVLVVSERVRLGEPAEEWVDPVSDAAVHIAKASRRTADPSADLALRRAADVLRAAGQARGAADVERMPLGAVALDDARPSSALRDLTRSLDSWARGRGREVEILADGISPDLLGQSFEVHGALAGDAVVSYAVRWHGERPAVLWESSVPVTIRCPSLDPSWSAEGTRGDALLPAPAA
jgi:hypothetical protein